MNEYIKIFIDKQYPSFIDKYLKTPTLNRIKYVTQFCGCDYTNIYNPLFLFTRFDHSLVVAHIVWHFTHDKKATIVALLHDVGTPCFAHTIDCVFGDYLEQESSEKQIADIVKKDYKLLQLLEDDGLSISDLSDMSKYPILENKAPNLCADRLDGVLHTCYIWLHSHSLEEIREVYEDLCILTNEYGHQEIGFNNKKIAIKFAKMVSVYSKELQSNRDKYVLKYISEIIKLSFAKGIVSLTDLYTKKEKEIIDVIKNSFPSWTLFEKASKVLGSTTKPTQFYISYEIKKRITIPLVNMKNKAERIIDVSKTANKIYFMIDNFKDKKYGYVKEIKNLE